MSPLKIAILKIIQANDGKFSWYQLDRALTQQAAVDPSIVSKELMPALRELEREGLIATAVGHNPSQPLYTITAAGLQQLQVHQT